MLRWFPAATCVVVAQVLVPVAIYAQDADAPPQYTIKQEVLGSHIPVDVARSVLPLNKRYADLNPADRARLASFYGHLKDGDEPPFPEHGMGALAEPIIKAQEHIGESGPLKMNIYIDAKGQAEKVEVLASPSREVTNFVAQAAMLIPWKPAKCDGKPCAMAFPLRLELERRL